MSGLYTHNDNFFTAILRFLYKTFMTASATPGPFIRKGIMLIFLECLAGFQAFGERVLPLMRTAKLAPPRAPRVRVS